MEADGRGNGAQSCWAAEDEVKVILRHEEKSDY